MISRRIPVCREKTSGDILAKQVCKCFIWTRSLIWLTNLGTIYGEVLKIFSCPQRLSNLRHFFICWRAFTQNNTKPTKTIKKSHETSWFQALFLQWACGHHHQYPDRQGSLFHIWKKRGCPIQTSCYCRPMLSMCVQGVRLTVQGVIQLQLPWFVCNYFVSDFYQPQTWLKSWLKV